MFDVYAQTVPDSLHCADTGLFQTLLMTILETMRKEMFEEYLDDWERRWAIAMHRLKIRLQRWTGIDTARIGKVLSNVGQKVSEAANSEEGSHALFKASEFRLLIQVRLFYHMLYDRTI